MHVFHKRVGEISLLTKSPFRAFFLFAWLPRRGIGKPRGANDIGVGSTVVGDADVESDDHSCSLKLSIEAIIDVSQHH